MDHCYSQPLTFLLRFSEYFITKNVINMINSLFFCQNCSMHPVLVKVLLSTASRLGCCLNHVPNNHIVHYCPLYQFISWLKWSYLACSTTRSFTSSFPTLLLKSLSTCVAHSLLQFITKSLNMFLFFTTIRCCSICLYNAYMYKFPLQMK